MGPGAAGQPLPRQRSKQQADTPALLSGKKVLVLPAKVVQKKPEKKVVLSDKAQGKLLKRPVKRETLPTDNLLEDTDGLRRLLSHPLPPQTIHQWPLDAGSLRPHVYADVRCIDDVIAIEGRQRWAIERLAAGGASVA